MFYSQFILAKKGPLGTIWIAAHLERKLRKNQVADTDIGVSVAYYLNPKYQYRCKLGLVQELVDAVQVVAAKLEPNSRMQPKYNQEIKTFRDALGSFGRLAAIDGRAGADADSILFPEVPIALRLSSHLLLGVVRIYSRKVNYLFHDCSEALLKVKQAFRSTVVDLPPDESTAPYHSITLPETFDLDDFELPDSALFQGNYVDHHVSTREQITLQDTMDGVVYSTTQFGLDERFGDGDTSQIGLDLDEDLLLDKAALSRHAEDLLPSEEDVGPQPCGEPMTPFTGMDIVEDDYNTERTAEIPEVILADGSGKQIGSNALELSMDDKSVFCNDQIKSPDLNVEGFRYKQIEGQYANPTKDLVEFSLPPSTSALAEDAILANVEGYPNKMASPCQSKDCNSMNLVVAGKPGDSIRELDVHIGNANYALECALLNDEKSGFDVLSMPSGKNESLTGGVQAIHVKQQGNSTPADSMDPVASDISRLVSSPTSVLAEQPKPVSPVSECSDRIAAVLDGQEGVISNNGLSISTIDQIHTKGMATQAIAVDTTVSFPACSPDALMLEETCGRPPCDNDTTISYKETSEPEAIKSEELVGDGAESCSRIHELQSSVDFLLGSEARHEIDQAEGNASAKPHDSNILNKYGPGEKSHTGSHVLQACSLQSNQLGVSSPPDGSLVENIPNLCCGRDGLLLTKTSEREEIPQASALSTDAQGEGCNQGLVANSIAEPFQPEDVQALSELDEHLDGVILEGTQLQISNFSASSDLPAPETLLSALAGAELPSDVMVGLILNKENPTEGSGDGSEVLSGKRHHSLESSPVLWSGKSAELSGVPQSRNVDSIPDDNDLLSSILVGRRSSALKVRPTPPPEVPSSKRPRVATRAHVPKRKVLVDDTMVLHGDTIRQQLTNTEDIRRIQRKAPCTRPEIWIIQKQLLEDEIFSEPIFTGMPMQLTGLQNRTYDLAKAELFQIDANCTPLGVLKGMKHTVSTDIAKETSLESCSKDVAVRHDGGALPAAVHVQAEDQHSKEHASLEGCEAVLVTNEGEAQTSTLNSSKDGQLEIITAMEIDRVNDEISDVVDHAATPGAELAVPSGPLSGDSSNLLAGSLKLSPVDNSSGAEVILQNDEAYSPQNKKLDLHKKGALIMGGNDDNGIQALYIVKVNDKSSISPGAVRAAKDESALVEAEGGMLSECPQDCQIVRGENTSAMAVAELNNCSVETRAGVQADSSAISFENINSSFPSMCLESGEQTAVVIVTGDQNIRGNNGVLDENATWSEQVNDEDGVTTSVDMDDVIFHGGEDPGCAGANQKNTIDAEISMLHSSAARETDVFEDLIDGNDTEFLNVDDDEVAEEEDNNMPCAEDAQFFENSGWSTRTRAVARYLQTLFDNDAGHEREVVRMDHLLAGKTRKESARMFFETLVLKTRDYIHFEQENAFANINIRSRGKLMKANF